MQSLPHALPWRGSFRVARPVATCRTGIDWSARRSRETRINKAYKLDPAKLGCFAIQNVNNVTLKNVSFVQTRPRSQYSPISRGLRSAWCWRTCSAGRLSGSKCLQWKHGHKHKHYKLSCLTSTCSNYIYVLPCPEEQNLYFISTLFSSFETFNTSPTYDSYPEERKELPNLWILSFLSTYLSPKNIK